MASIKIETQVGKRALRLCSRHQDCIILAGLPENAGALAALEGRIFPKELYGSDVLSLSKFRYFLKKANAIVPVILSQDKIVGYAILLFRKNSLKARLYALAVDENLRGRGLALALMKVCDDMARDAGCRHITLETRADNKAMQSLAERAEYKRSVVLKSYYFDNTDAFKYIRTLHSEDKNGS